MMSEERGRQEKGRLLWYGGKDSPGKLLRERDVKERRKKVGRRAYICKFRHPLYVKPTEQPGGGRGKHDLSV